MTSLADPLSATWIEWCTAEGHAANTVAARSRTLRSIGTAGTATREDVEQWWTTRRHLSDGTRSNDLGNLRTFYKWCQVWEHRADDPTLRLTAPKVGNNLPKWVSRADMAKLLDALPTDLRRAVCLGAYGGLRVSEVAALDWSDVSIETRRARIEGSKGKKSRLVAFGPVLIDSLLPDTGGNVVTSGGATYSAAALQRRVNRAIRSAGVDGTFHRLRHRYGTLAYQATGDIIAVGRQMGHSSPVTTAIYAAASDEMADRIAEAVTR